MAEPAPRLRTDELGAEPQHLSVALPALLAQAGARDGSDLLALLRADQHRRWARGERVPVEEYLQHIPALGADAELAVDLIVSEVLCRARRGERIQPEEYLRRIPQYAEALQQQFTFHQMLLSVLGPATPGQWKVRLAAARSRPCRRVFVWLVMTLRGPAALPAVPGPLEGGHGPVLQHPDLALDLHRAE
jgi:hypothetical protein